LCVREALKGSQSGPTIAQDRVFDSRMSEIKPEELAADAKPVLVVYTDADEGDALSAQNGGPPFHRMIDVIIEMTMIARAEILDNDGNPTGDYIVGTPNTDSRLEGSLDLLEYQVVRRLSADGAPLCVLFRKIARIRKRECHRQVDDTPGVKIATRILVLTCEVNDDQDQIFNSAGVVPSGLDGLPEPLRSVAIAMPSGSSGATIAQAIAAAVSPPLTADPLKGIDLTVTASGATDAADKIDVPTDLAQPDPPPSA
jgi:hypothetical protein